MKAWTTILTYVVVIDLKGDNLTWFYNPPKLVGEGEVKVKLGEISIDAERVEISLDTSELQAIGRVKLCFYPYTIILRERKAQLYSGQRKPRFFPKEWN